MPVGQMHATLPYGSAGCYPFATVKKESLSRVGTFSQGTVYYFAGFSILDGLSPQ
jgi:hypothetical protein